MADLKLWAADPRFGSSRISTTDCRNLKALVGASISNLAEIALWPDCYGEDGPVPQARRGGGVDRQEELAGLLGAELRRLALDDGMALGPDGDEVVAVDQAVVYRLKVANRRCRASAPIDRT